MIRAYVHCEKCSYEEVAKYENFKITHNLFDAEVCIDDPVIFLQRIRGIKDDVNCVLWGDTVYNAMYYTDKLVMYKKFIVPSLWNYNMFLKIGIIPMKILKRHIRPIYKEVKKDKLFITLGESRYFDRKNLTLINSITSEMGLRKDTIIVGNMGNPDYYTFSLTEENKYELYARSKFFLALSKSEGFGIPPIEAMAVGVIPIYLNAHGYKENLIGIPIDPVDEYTLCTDNNNCFKVWEPSKHELKYEITHAMNMSNDEYNDLVTKVKDRAKSYIYSEYNIKELL